MRSVALDIDLDQTGKRSGLVRIPHSSHASAYGWVPAPITVVANGSGSTVVLTAGIHGDEYEGQIALAELAETLQPADVCGRVIIMPVVGVPASLVGNRLSPVDQTNINRIFPGNPAGTPSERLADFIESELFARADYAIDFHSGGTSLLYESTTICVVTGELEADAERRAIAQAFGAPWCMFFDPPTLGIATIDGAMLRKNVIGITGEYGGGGSVSAAAANICRRGVRNALAHLGVLVSAYDVEQLPPPRNVWIDPDNNLIFAMDDGVFEPLVAIGEVVDAGQCVARLHRPEMIGVKAIEICATASGIVMCHRAIARTNRGDCLFQIGTPMS